MTARRDPSHLVVGYLQRAHGVHGEIFVAILTDHPESAFAPGVVLSPGEADEDEPSPDLPPLRVRAARPYQKGLLVQFGGVEDRTQARLLTGRYLFRAVEDLEPLEEGEVFHHQLLGMAVRTVGGEDVGSVSHVVELHPADLLEVRTADGVIMVPYRSEIIVEVDVDEGVLVIDPPEGLLELGAG
ncbi:MAG: ribosome maturation factor RimM [Longimicrobiales bacterium]|nr:ribosome maturation factor RimM [Longimicrobiales bacterium]